MWRTRLTTRSARSRRRASSPRWRERPDRRQRRRHRPSSPIRFSDWCCGGPGGQRLRGRLVQRHDSQDHAGGSRDVRWLERPASPAAPTAPAPRHDSTRRLAWRSTARATSTWPTGQRRDSRGHAGRGRQHAGRDLTAPVPRPVPTASAVSRWMPCWQRLCGGHGQRHRSENHADRARDDPGRRGWRK